MSKVDKINALISFIGFTGDFAAISTLLGDWIGPGYYAFTEFVESLGILKNIYGECTGDPYGLLFDISKAILNASSLTPGYGTISNILGFLLSFSNTVSIIPITKVRSPTYYYPQSQYP